MRKIIFSVLGAVTLLLTGCDRGDLGTMAPDGEISSVSLSVAMGDVSATRAIADQGTAGEINRVILEVYTTSDGALYKRIVKDAIAGASTTSFDLRLVTSETYDFVAWADCSSDGLADKYYDTDSEGGLQAITADYSKYTGNDEERDAFFGTQQVEVTSSAVSFDMTLTRPFGQLNISTNLTDIIDEMCPDKISISYATKVATTFNALTGAVSGAEEIDWVNAVEVIDINDSAKGGTNVHLSTDYILVAADGETLFDFEISLIDGRTTPDTTTKEFVNIPIKRNYRTNISGELLSVDGQFDVDLSSGFEGTLVGGEVTVDDVAALNALSTNLDYVGDVVINVKNVANDSGSTYTTIYIPDTSSATSITIVVENITADTEIHLGDDSLYDKTVNIIVPTDPVTAKLVVDLPNAHVEFAGWATDADVTTGPATFVVREGAKIENLTVTAGEVEILGEVGTGVNDEGEIIAAIVDLSDFSSSAKIADGATITVESTDTSDTTITASELSSLKSAFPTDGEVTLVLEGCETLGSSAFSVVSNAKTRVSISSTTITEIGEDAFSGAIIGSIDLPNLTTIGAGAFEDTTSTDRSGETQEVIATFENVETVGESAFEESCFSEIYLPSATTIATRAFYKAKATIIEIPSVEIIPYEAFLECPNLVTLKLDSVKELTSIGIKGCKLLTELYMPCLERLSKTAFVACSGITKMTMATTSTSFTLTGGTEGSKVSFTNGPEPSNVDVIIGGNNGTTVNGNVLTIKDSFGSDCTITFKSITVE